MEEAAVLKILRVEVHRDGYFIDRKFVGLADIPGIKSIYTVMNRNQK